MTDITTKSSALQSNISKTKQTDRLNPQNQSRQGIVDNKVQASGDTVNLTYSSETATTYNHSMSLEGVKQDGYDLLRGLVLNIFKEQGIDYKISTGDTEIDLETLTPEKAQELIADDGYFGVEQTSERIFKFAVGMAGDDPARVDAIREGVEKGFQEALNAFGGELPQISYDTYDSVMNKLDEWAGTEHSPQS